MTSEDTRMSKSLLRDRLEQRIAALVEACPRCWGALLDGFESGELIGHVGQGEAHTETRKPVPRSTFTAGALAARVEQNVRAAAVLAIEDERERAAALDRPIVAERWPLEVGPTWGETDEDVAAIVALNELPSYAEEEGGLEPDGWVWPASINPFDVGAVIAKGGTAESDLIAEALRKGFYSPGRGFSFKVGEVVKVGAEKRSRPLPPGPAEVWFRAHEGQTFEGLLLWSPVGFAVLLAALAEVRDAAALDTALGCARFAWANVVRLAGDIDALGQIAGDALRRSPERLHPMARDARARDELARELQAHLRLVREATGLDGPEPRDEGEATAIDGGILAVDARLLAYLAARGNTGAALEKQQRSKAEERAARFREDGKGAGLWHLWADQGTAPKGSRAALLLAGVLWADVVEPWLRQSPGLVHPVMVDITAAYSRGFAPVTRGGQIVLPLPGGEGQIGRSPEGAVAAVDAEAFPAIERGLTLLGGVTAHRLLRWEVFQGHAQWQSGEPNPADLVIDGGWSALAHDLLGMKGQKAVADVRAIVLAQAHFRFTLPGGGRGNLLSYDETPARGGRRGRVKIRLGDALLPGYLFELARTMGDGNAARAARRLVPMVVLPPFVGREREHGPQATLSMIFVTELRERARELVEHGGILLDLDAWATLAERAALPRGGAGSLPRVLDRWTHDGDDGPAFLVKVGRDRYTLGPAHAAARNFVGEAGRRETEGSAAGKRSAARRARPRPRKTAKG